MNENENDIRLKRIEDNIEEILNILKGDVQPNCSKMGTHINFVENVYDNVKNPLGFFCSKLNLFQNSNTNYTLEDI